MLAVSAMFPQSAWPSLFGGKAQRNAGKGEDMSGQGIDASGSTERATSGFDTALDMPVTGKRPDIRDLEVAVKPLNRRIAPHTLMAPSVGALIDPSATSSASRRQQLLADVVYAIREIVGALAAEAPMGRPLAMIGAHLGRRCGQEDAFGPVAAKAAQSGSGLERAFSDLSKVCRSEMPKSDHVALKACLERCEAAGPEALGQRDFCAIREGGAELMTRFGCPAVRADLRG